MNKVILMGRLARDPEVRYTEGEKPCAVARYTLAVDDTQKDKDGNKKANFINCVALGKMGEFAEKYLHKGMKILVEGSIKTGSYTNKDGNKVYTTDVMIEKHFFVESKTASDEAVNNAKNDESFMNIPGGIDDEVPFL